MQCYIDAEAGTSKHAVAICNACGVGLCLKHLVDEEMTRHAPGLSGHREQGRRILCEVYTPGFVIRILA